MSIAPCKDCGDRYVGCHGKCWKYQAYKYIRAKENEQRYKENMLLNVYLRCDHKNLYSNWMHGSTYRHR